MPFEEEAATLRTENTERLAKASSDVLLTAHRSLAKNHGVVTSGPRAQVTLINAVSGRLRAMLAESGVLSTVSKAGDGGGMRLPNGFANDPESWLRNNASEWRICGWPTNLPGARISAWPSAQMYAVLALLLEGRIFLVCTAPSSSTIGASRVTAPQHIEPPKTRPRKSGAAESRSVTGTAHSESDVEEKGDELEVMGLLDEAEQDEPLDATGRVTAPPESDVDSVQSASKGKGKAKPKTVKERMQARKPPPTKPRISLLDVDGDESEARTTDNSSSAHDSTDEDSSDDDSERGSEEYTPEPGATSTKKPSSSAKPIKSEPSTSGKASGQGRKRTRDSNADGATEPAAKKHKRSRNSFEASYKAALNKEKAEEKAKAKEKKQAERQKAREERAAQKEREKREKRELRAMKEAAREAELLAQDDRERRHVVEEGNVKGHKRRHSTRSEFGLDERNTKRTKTDD